MYRMDQCVTPWPCFVLAANEEFAKSRPSELRFIAMSILESTAEVMREPNSIEHIAKMYRLKEDQTAKWFHQTEWQVSPWVSRKMIQNVQYTLKQLGLIESINVEESFCVEGVKLF